MIGKQIKKSMKRFLIITFFLFSFMCSGISQVPSIIEPIKEPCLVTFKENPLDTFALINVQRLRNINEKILYMYELMEIKDSLYSAIDGFTSATKTRDEIIKVQAERILNLSELYRLQQSALVNADEQINKQDKQLKTKNKIITALGISTGASVLLLLLMTLVK